MAVTPEGELGKNGLRKKERGEKNGEKIYLEPIYPVLSPKQLESKACMATPRAIF